MHRASSILILITILSAPGLTSTASAQSIGDPADPVAKRLTIRAPAKRVDPGAFALRLGYIGEAAVNPGLLVGAELQRTERRVDILRARGKSLSERRRLVQTLWTADASTYRQPRSHRGALLMVGVTRRTIFGKSLKLELGGSAGYMHVIPDGVVFDVQDDGTLVERRIGRPKFAARGMIGFGQEFMSFDGPLSALGWTLRGGLLLQAPHNTFVLPHGVVEATLTYRFGRGS